MLFLCSAVARMRICRALPGARASRVLAAARAGGFYPMAHLQQEIRSSLMQAQQELASHFGFKLGDHVKANGVELYAFKISCYPLEDIARL